MRCAWLNSGGSVWEREWSLFIGREKYIDIAIYCNILQYQYIANS